MGGTPDEFRPYVEGYGTMTRKNFVPGVMAGVNIRAPPVPGNGAPTLAQPAGSPVMELADWS